MVLAASPAWSAPSGFLGCPAAPALDPGAVTGTQPPSFASGSACAIVCPSPPHIKPWHLYCPANATYCFSTYMVCDGTVMTCEQCDDVWFGGPAEARCSWTTSGEIEDR